jgi:hypothetical protein
MHLNFFIKNIKTLLVILLTGSFFCLSCGNSNDITTYYFPVKALENGKVYEYKSLNEPNLAHDYWYYQTLKADPKASEKRGQFFTGTHYDGRFQITQIISEEVVSNGMLLDDTYIFQYDSLENQTRIKPVVLSPSVYPFEIKKDGTIYLYSIKWKDPKDSTHTTTVTKQRHYVGQATYNFKGKTYDCVELEVKETIFDDKNGRWQFDYKTKELYAKGIGLIYYKKTLGKEIQEFELADIYEMSELEKKFSKEIQ